MGTEWLCDIDEGLFHQASYSFSFLTSHCLKPTNIYWPAWLGRYISDSYLPEKIRRERVMSAVEEVLPL